MLYLINISQIRRRGLIQSARDLLQAPDAARRELAGLLKLSFAQRIQTGKGFTL